MFQVKIKERLIGYRDNSYSWQGWRSFSFETSIVPIIGASYTFSDFKGGNCSLLDCNSIFVDLDSSSYILSDTKSWYLNGFHDYLPILNHKIDFDEVDRRVREGMHQYNENELVKIIESWVEEGWEVSIPHKNCPEVLNKYYQTPEIELAFKEIFGKDT